MDRRFLFIITAVCSLIGIREQGFSYEFEMYDENFSNECCGNNESPWVARIEAAGAVGQFIGQKHNYLELGLFGGPAPSDDLFFFVDARGYWLEKNRHAASVGGGIRMLSRSCGTSRIWGANLYYDYNEGKHKGFNQIGIGLESLGACLDFRVNAYIPIETKACSSSRTYSYPDGWEWQIREREFSYKGVDGEIGYRLWQYCNFTVYGAAGPYYYHSKGPHQNVYGGQIRLEARYLDYVTLEARFSDDNRYHAEVQGKLIISIPIDQLMGCFSYDRCRAFFTQPVKRNGLAFFDHCCNAKWNW